MIQVLEREHARRGYYPLELCSDSGTEFVNKKLDDFCKSHHITHIISAPYHPEHKGKAESANRKISESVRSTLRSSKINKIYWHKILKSSCISLNHIPRPGNKTSPYEVFHNKALPHDYLKPKGTRLVYQLMSRDRGRKFDEKGQEGTSVGYNAHLLSY